MAKFYIKLFIPNKENFNTKNRGEKWAKPKEWF